MSISVEVSQKIACARKRKTKLCHYQVISMVCAFIGHNSQPISMQEKIPHSNTVHIL